MSQKQVNLSPDLRRLRDEGFDIEVRLNHLLVKTPYVNANREVKLGILVSELSLAGDVTIKPGTHVAHFVGEHPCNKDGSEIAQIKHGSGETKLDSDLVVQHSFSNKPKDGYTDFYHKMTTYVAIISNPARSIDPDATPNTFPAIQAEADESVFNYVDTASSRAQINVVTRKLEIGRVGIVGLGGTGSYVLDLVAKTPVKEIHLFDGDKFSQHNAFRSPGAPSIGELKEEPQKVTYFGDKYSRMHRGIVAHDVYLGTSNLMLLEGMNFVFLSLDRGEAKRLIIEKLEELRIPFIDVGMGVELVDESLLGILRITTSTVEKRDHVRSRVSLSDGEADNDYSRNIQIADLNALNAALAVIKWKKMFGFYHDMDHEHHCTYTIDGNALDNGDR